MAVDKSLKVKGGLLRRRNVLSREERLQLLEGEGRWESGESVFGLPKVSTRVRKTRKKKKATEPEAVVPAVEGAIGAEETVQEAAGEAPES